MDVYKAAEILVAEWQLVDDDRSRWWNTDGTNDLNNVVKCFVEGYMVFKDKPAPEWRDLWFIEVRRLDALVKGGTL